MKEFFELGKNLLLLLIIFLILVFAGKTINLGQPAGKEPVQFLATTALVTKVIDGDTIIIEGGKNVRLLGIDADEHDELCYEIARERLKELILNKPVQLTRELRDGDVYGRLLRYIFLDGQNIDLELIKEGLVVARASYEGGMYDKQFAEAEYLARQNKTGCKWVNK